MSTSFTYVILSARNNAIIVKYVSFACLIAWYSSLFFVINFLRYNLFHGTLFVRLKMCSGTSNLLKVCFSGRSSSFKYESDGIYFSLALSYLRASQIHISECSCSACVYITSNALLSNKSSASQKITYFPCACFKPLFLATPAY